MGSQDVGSAMLGPRGLRQGDPLSPMLFVMVMEVLNNLLRWVEQRGLMELVAGLAEHRVSLYADDLVLFVRPDEWSVMARLLKALVWFWIIDETLVLTYILSECRLNEIDTCQVMEHEMIMVMMMMMMMTTR
jgi:hypothetical protein